MRTIYHYIKRSSVKILTIFVLLFFTTQNAKAVCPVTADFTYQIVGNTVTFSPVQQADTLVYFNWSFGNNNYSNQTSNVVNTYINAGNYIVRFQVSGRDPIDTSIHCNEVKFDTILIENSIPCEHINSTKNTTLYFPNNNIGVGFCTDYNNCLFPNSFTIIGNAFHGNISENGSSCFLYQTESVGIDTIKIISCNTINNCDTTTHIINVSQRPVCNQITEDTIYLQLDTTFSGSYSVPSFFDSLTNTHQQFILEEWSTSTFTLTPNRLFDSIIQLYRYIDSVSNNIFEFNGNTSIYSTNNNAVAYSGGGGLKFFIPTIISSSQTRFNYSLNTSANYCSPFPINGRYFLTNQNFYYPYYSCSPNNVGVTFYQNGINNVTIIDSLNNCFENVVIVVGNGIIRPITTDTIKYTLCRNCIDTLCPQSQINTNLISRTMCDGSSSVDGFFSNVHLLQPDYCLIVEAGVVMGSDTFCIIDCDSILCDTTYIVIDVSSNRFIIRDSNVINATSEICLPVYSGMTSAVTVVSFADNSNNSGNTYIADQGCIRIIRSNLVGYNLDTVLFIVIDTISGLSDTTIAIISNADSLTLCDTTTCLLPGDADHDFTVNNYDALAIGLSYNRTGVVRANATTQYTLQACDNWNTTHFYGYNDKFADCNGDGIINSNDALVIDRNYIAQAQNVFNHRQSQLDSLPSVTLAFDTLPTMVVNGNYNGAELVADINVGSTNQPLVNGYGIAFSVNYPFDSDSCFSVTVDLDPNSWFQTNNPVLLFYKNIPQYKRVDVSVVRTDGLPRTGNGRIGKIKMITEGGIFRSGRLSSNKVFDFSVSDVAAINQIGQRIYVNGSSATVSFITLGTKQNKVEGLKFYPNPTTGKIYINAKETIESIKIIDTQGRIINEFIPHKDDIQLDVSNVENGMYILEIKSRNGVSYEKIFKQ